MIHYWLVARYLDKRKFRRFYTLSCNGMQYLLYFLKCRTRYVVTSLKHASTVLAEKLPLAWRRSLLCCRAKFRRWPGSGPAGSTRGSKNLDSSFGHCRLNNKIIIIYLSNFLWVWEIMVLLALLHGFRDFRLNSGSKCPVFKHRTSLCQPSENYRQFLTC